MAWVRKANVVLEVRSDEEAERYLDMGYNITDEWGHVIKECVPHDAGTLRRYYFEHVEEIAKLKARITELEKQLKSAKAKQSKKAGN